MIETCTRFFRVARRDLAYVKFIIEAYEGLAVLSTVERHEAIVSIATPSCRAAELDLFLDALSREIAMTETAPCFAPSHTPRGTCHA